MRKIYGTVLLLAAAVLAGCAGRNDVKVEGCLAGVAGEVYLEKVGSGASTAVDTASLDDAGRFAFKVSLADGLPAIYNLRYGKEQLPLLLAPGDKPKIEGGAAGEYTVSGSDGSERMRELRAIMLSGGAVLDSLRGEFASAGDDIDRRVEIAREYNEQYNKAKREHITFVISNPASLAGLYALYQRFPNDDVLFMGEGDMVYYRMVADTISQVYPESPYVKKLQKDLVAADSQALLADRINSQIEATSDLGFPDIELPDMYGAKQRLSALAGKVILLDFWLSSDQRSKMNNAELKERYGQWAERGVEIYQVSADTEKALWVMSVQQQKLPWISVCDQRARAGHAFMAYNVRSVPANYIIDRNGSIVAKNLYGEKLYGKIDELAKSSAESK